MLEHINPCNDKTCLNLKKIVSRLGHTKLMFRITDFSDHLLGGEGGIKIKIKVRSANQ